MGTFLGGAFASISPKFPQILLELVWNVAFFIPKFFKMLAPCESGHSPNPIPNYDPNIPPQVGPHTPTSPQGGQGRIWPTLKTCLGLVVGSVFEGGDGAVCLEGGDDAKENQRTSRKEHL